MDSRKGTTDVRSHAETLWRYHQLGHALAPADLILVLCSHDTSVADTAAALWLDGWAPRLMFSGGLGAITRHLWQEPEADQFARRAVALGVPADRILVENRSTNTGENVRFSRDVLAANGLDPETFIVVQKPYMERRSYATFMKVWPGKRVIAASPRASFDDYLQAYANAALTPDDVIGIMVGDLQRILVYPSKGFQIAQEVPADVLEAYHALVGAGFDKYLVKE